MMDIFAAATPADYEKGKRLFIEYAESLEYDICFQSFDRELLEIRTQYGAPDGVLLLAVAGDAVGGCVGVRRWQGDIAELKRMYVQPSFRGAGGGRLLLDAALDHARALGYRSIRLDTLPGMEAAIALYRASGFHDIPPYRENPYEGTLYLEKNLY